jgi:integrase
MTADRGFKIVREKYPTGTTTYLVRGYLDGKQIKKRSKDRDWAKQECDRLNRERLNVQRSLRPVLAGFGADEAIDAERALKLLAGHATLEEAARFYLEHNKFDATGVTVREALDEYLHELDMRVVRKTMRQATFKGTKNRLLRFFHGCESMQLKKLTPAFILARLEAVEKSLASLDNSRRCLRTFLEWCLEIPREYIQTNPCDAVKIRKPEVDNIAVLTADQAEKLMRAAEDYREGKMVPFYALALFVGIRPNGELSRLTWDDIDLASREIHIRKSIAKTKTPRTIPIPDNLAEWLLKYHDRHIYPPSFERHFRAVYKSAGIKKWTQDLLRHTAISFLFEKIGEFGRTAEIMGNSEGIIRQRYRGRVDRSTVDQFWNIRPGGSNAEKS